LAIKDEERPAILQVTHMMNFKFIKYKFEGVINKFNVLSWIENVKKGLVTQYSKSALPLTEEQQKKNYVPVLVSSEFDSKVKKHFLKNT